MSDWDEFEYNPKLLWKPFSYIFSRRRKEDLDKIPTVDVMSNSYPALLSFLLESE